MTTTISLKTFIIMLLASAVLIGVIYSYPDICFIKDSGVLYKGVDPIGFVDETLYLGRINAARRGGFAARNPAIYEHRSDPVIMPAFCEYVESGLGKLFGLDVTKTDMAATFLLPSVLFFLIALFAYRLSNSAWGALGAASAVLLGMHFFSRLFLFSGKVFNGSHSLPLWFARPITPQAHFVFFVAAIYFIYKSLADEKIIFSVLGGLFLGSLFYVSVFYWMYIYTILGVLFMIFAVNRDILSIKRIMIIGVVAIAISIPYWFENVKTMAHPYYGMLLYRFNVGFTHKPIFPISAAAVLTAVLLARNIIVKEAGKKAFYFMSSMPIAIIITLNQQIVTGKLFKESHWTTYTGKFAVIVCLVSVASLLLRRIYKNRQALSWCVKGIAISFFATLLIHGMGMQINYHARHFSENLDMQQMAGAFNWINKNASADDVILPSPNHVRLSEILPIYTKGYVYYSEPFFCLSLIPAEETRYRMLAAYRLFGFSPEDARAHPYSWNGAIFLTSNTNRDKSYLDYENAKFGREYQDMLLRDGLMLAKKYKVDYILAVDKMDAITIQRLVDSGHDKVYDDGRYSIIKVGGQHG